MINPAKVIAFIDVLGDFDPSLAFVMATAIPITALGYALAARRHSPICAPGFSLPTRREIDRSWFSVQSSSASVGGWSAIAVDQPLLASVSVILRLASLFLRCSSAWVVILPCHRCSAAARSTPERLSHA
jgi:hypothetical protein